MPTALIADDEPPLARALAAMLGALWPELEIVHIARNGIEAAERIAALQPDLAFLDIRMPGLTGLEVAQGIEGGTRVVFVTAFDAYAVEAFEREALDYLLKPVTPERLGRTVERVRRGLAATPSAAAEDAADDSLRLLAALQRLLPGAAAPPYAQSQSLAQSQAQAQASQAQAPRLRGVRASAGEITHQVAVEDVLFFRADDKYTCVHTAGSEHLIRTPIADLAHQLDPQQFVQMHRSTIVNLAFLAGTRRDETSRLFLRLKGHAHELPVSRAYVHLFKAM